MSFTINADDSRSIKALEIAAGHASWLKVRSHEGELGFAIPSQCPRTANRYYLVTAYSCNCEDFRRHGLRSGRIGMGGDHRDCKHIKAVQLVDELQRAMEAPKTPRRHLR